MVRRAHEMMVKVGRFVDGLKAAGVEFFVGEPVKFPCGCYGQGRECGREWDEFGLGLGKVRMV